jgi:hypothetical protein
MSLPVQDAANYNESHMRGKLFDFSPFAPGPWFSSRLILCISELNPRPFLKSGQSSGHGPRVAHRDAALRSLSGVVRPPRRRGGHERPRAEPAVGGPAAGQLFLLFLPEMGSLVSAANCSAASLAIVLLAIARVSRMSVAAFLRTVRSSDNKHAGSLPTPGKRCG